MRELESLLEKMKLKREEDIANLELLLEEIKLEEIHVPELRRFTVKAKKIKSVREESKEMQFEKRRDKLESLFHEMKCWPQETLQTKFRIQHETKLEFLLEGIELKQEEERLQSRELEMELEELELLVKEIESERHVEVPQSLALKMRLEGHLGKVKSLLEAVKMEHEEQIPELPAMKVQLEERILQRNKIIFLTSERQLKECIKALDSLQGKLSLQFTGELKSQALKIELDKHIEELESLLKKEMELEISEKLSFENWETHIQKSESLLNKLEWECNKEILPPFVWELILKGHAAKEKSVLEGIELTEEKILMFPTFAIELKQHIVKLESLIVETKLKQEEGLKS